MSCLINCLFWSPGDPKILYTADLEKLIGNETRKAPSPGVPYLPQKLTCISDISADSNGSLEFMVNCTTVDQSFEVINPQKHRRDINIVTNNNSNQVALTS